MNISKFFLPFVDALTISVFAFFTFGNYVLSVSQLVFVVLWLLFITLITLFFQKFYEEKRTFLKNTLTLFNSLAIGITITSLVALFLGNSAITYLLLVIFTLFTFIGIIAIRVVCAIFSKFRRTKNVLIVGAGQDGKLMAEEIAKRKDLKLKVVGFLDDNMNSIEDEDSTIPILGLTCDSEAVIKDNNVKLVIIAVKSRMDSSILTDLVRGIPLGVKVWRMYKFYEKITSKFLVSKMSVNWLFYDCVRKKALIYAYIKRFCDIIASIAILLITLPLSIIAILGIKLSDLGPIFFTQMRIGKLGKPFKMIKFRTMYQDEVADDFDDDLTEVELNDKRIMPFCRILRKFHIDEIPQMLNVLRGDMSIVGPRPVREEVYYENRENIPFWECRNWVRPGWCGWQQVKVNEPTAEERLGYDLYYIKHRNVIWEFAIFISFVGKVILGKARGK